jgi:hypothetical protein
MRRIMRVTLVVVGALGIATPALAESTAAEANAALSFWMTWGLVYLGIGVALMAVAVGIAVRERRAWSSLLEWPDGADAPPSRDAEGRRAA